MRQNLRKVICIVLCIAITIQPVTIISANTGEYYSTVSDELLFALGIDRKAFNSGQFDEVGIEYPCIIWVNDIDMEPAVIYGFDCAEKTRDHPRNSANYPYEVIYNDGEKDLFIDVSEEESDEYVQTYIEAKREKAKELYSYNNGLIVEEKLKSIQEKIEFISSYSPCIFANLTATEIFNLDQLHAALFIDYNNIESEDTEEIVISNSNWSSLLGLLKEELPVHLEILHIDTARSTYGVNGSGAKIGQLEPHYSDLPGITQRPYGSNYTHYHASMVHYILATIAPGASFYGAGYNCSSAYSDFYEAVEWLVGKGVNIINMSASAYTSTANVTSYSGCTRWIEHIAYNHDTHFVKSSGDRGSIGVTEPGMAYNIITVGGIEYELDYQRWENSSYYNGLIDRTENKTRKPDMMAFGWFDSLGGGTSFSSPEVAATIALMCNLQPSLKTKQHIVKAILGATVLKNNRKHVTAEYAFREYGAGIIDAKSALIAVNAGHFSSTTGTVSNSNTTKSYSMSVTSSDTCMRVSLAYAHRIKFGDNVSNHTGTNAPYAGGYIGELRLDVYNPSGVLIAFQNTGI